MASIFISYRHEDTSGETGRLAADLMERFGRSRVFVDVNSIDAGANFERRIEGALDAAQVTFVMIGDRWLTAKLPDGARRIDDPADYVRQEIVAALGRDGMQVVPVLVEGARMPSAAELPDELAELSKLQARELSIKRWGYDLGQLCAVAKRYDRPWTRAWRAVPRAVRGALAGIALAAVCAAAVVAATSGSSTPRVAADRAILAPAKVPPKVAECTQQLQFFADGTVGPLSCTDGRLNRLAWQHYGAGEYRAMALGPYASQAQVQAAICADVRTGRTTNPTEQDAYKLAALYYGWRFAAVPDPGAC